MWSPPPPPKPVCSPTTLPRTFNFYFAVPVAPSYPKGDTWLDVRHGTAGAVNHTAAEQNGWLYVCPWVTRSSLHPYVCLCLSSLPSNHEFIIPSTVYRRVHLTYLPYLKTCNVPASSALRDSRSCRRQYYQKCKTLIQLAVRKVERGERERGGEN